MQKEIFGRVCRLLVHILRIIFTFTRFTVYVGFLNQNDSASKNTNSDCENFNSSDGEPLPTVQLFHIQFHLVNQKVRRHPPKSIEPGPSNHIHRYENV